MLGGVSIFLRDVVRFLCIFFSFLFFSFTLPHVYWLCDHLTYIVLIFGLYIYIYIYIYMYVLMYVISPISPCVGSFLSLYTCFLLMYAILYFCFTLRCLDEFCLKCFRSTGCQSLIAINSLLAKFFKSLC